MDYAFCQAAAYRTGKGKTLLPVCFIYDIGCQWGINFMERVRRAETLSFSEFRRWMVAVGKFHLGSHVKHCFCKFSLNFIKGVGQIDGEIMETLWAEFNKFGVMARSMSSAHWKEILNDHMRDWNWKKMVGMCLYSFVSFVFSFLII
jgi:Kyakuja-Dileera-Zisupton transposase